MTRQLYICTAGTYTKAPRGYYRLEAVLAVVTASIGLHVLIGAWFAFVVTGVTL